MAHCHVALIAAKSLRSLLHISRTRSYKFQHQVHMAIDSPLPLPCQCVAALYELRFDVHVRPLSCMPWLRGATVRAPTRLQESKQDLPTT